MTQQQTRQDVVNILLEQHEQVKALFARLERSSGEASEETFCELRRMLAVHETAEEEIVYPALRTIGDAGKRVADQRIEEESKAKKVLAQLETMDTSSSEFTSTLHTFKSAVTDHAESEEREVFPLLREHLSDSKRETMAKAFKIAEAAAPTHPHPHAPSSAVGNLTLGPTLAIMDRVRDAIHGAQAKKKN